jgi:hypothetical protein
MDAIQLRTNLLQQIEQADEKLLRVISSVLEAVKVEYVVEEAIGYRAGEEVTVATLKTSIAKAEDQIDQGEFLTADDLEKETEEWLSSIE